ncbi:hypothetical protein RI103_37165 (plasmid) [Paraburkholderia sp. FT54]|uniref:hypothetical protein n=1 Tax=Paraburkholderia sp. FT54 TaxID=3074437 RepID=UPI00287745C7|nr:hypothetical protein [Paraburkholderia sp. FT54]WNC95374.1 hypothetical protein RI103_37165 [Paraburkholderia sp. FT54]
MAPCTQRFTPDRRLGALYPLIANLYVTGIAQASLGAVRVAGGSSQQSRVGQGAGHGDKPAEPSQSAARRMETALAATGGSFTPGLWRVSLL